MPSGQVASHKTLPACLSCSLSSSHTTCLSPASLSALGLLGQEYSGHPEYSVLLSWHLGSTVDIPTERLQGSLIGQKLARKGWMLGGLRR